ncbi:MAG TPA: hypothetical protein VK457_15995 [Chloroflexota bacterium]|jgi:hypothetical protein|nr:hypothetical protein [Chloroflexota bacterium]
MAVFKSQAYVVELYAPGAVDPNRYQVTFTKRDGSSALVSGGETTFAAAPRSCTCVDFTLGDQVCAHMRARERAFRRFARDYGLVLPGVARPLWAEDVGDE